MKTNLHVGVCVVGLLFVAILSAAADPLAVALQVKAERVFASPLDWAGTRPPAETESLALLKAIDMFNSGGVGAGFQAFDDFITAHPKSEWLPALEVNMAEYYRSHGQYTLALSHWSAAWDETKDGHDHQTQQWAARTVAGWTRLLASLGEKEKLDAIFKEVNDRQLPLGVNGTIVEETKEGLAMMKSKPGASYRCGSFALGHMAMELGFDPQTSQKFFEADSPDGGFRMSDLLLLAQTNGLAVEAVHRPAGAALVVPSVVHWKLNHYAAITAKKGNLYRVNDPTFQGHVWLDAATIETESSDDFIVVKGETPAWRKLTPAECASIYGKGYPNCIDDTADTDNSCPMGSGGAGGPSGPSGPGGTAGGSGSGGGGDNALNDGVALSGTQDVPLTVSPQNSTDPDNGGDSGSAPAAGNSNPGGSGGCAPGCGCGMPQWNVSEPYITLWLQDAPLLYHLSNGQWSKLQLAYKSRGDAQNSSLSGFGDQWSCNWLGMLQSVSTNTDSITDFRAGGGQEAFNTDGTPSYKSARQFSFRTFGDPVLISPTKASSSYGLTVGSGIGTTNYLLTDQFDRYGKVYRHINYQTVGTVTRVSSVVDMDGRTNTLTYGNGTFPNLITAVTDPYGRTAHFNYNGYGLLTNIVDVQGMSTYFQYDSSENITNMVTLYGTTSFEYFEGRDTNDDGLERGLLITEPSGDHQAYVYQDNAIGATPPGCVSDWWLAGYRLSFHWNRAQYLLVSSAGQTNLFAMTGNDFDNASVKHWLHGDQTESMSTVSGTLDCSADAYDPVLGTRPNCVGYYYQGESTPYIDNGGAFALKLVTDITLDGSEAVHSGISDSGITTNIVYYNYAAPPPNPYSVTPQTSYTNLYDSSGTILRSVRGPRGELVGGYGYDPVITNLLVTVTNALTNVYSFTYNTNLQVTSIKFPGGMVRTNIYYTSGLNKNFVAQQIDIGFRTNSFVYTNGNLAILTNELGLVTTYAYDSLNRLIAVGYPDTSTISNVYSKLDIVATKDRLNQWSYYGYNNLRQVVAMTNVDGQITTLDYCGCGSPDEIARWNGANALVTYYAHNLSGLVTNVIYPDGYQLNYSYDDYNRVADIMDALGNQEQYYYALFGQQAELQYQGDGPFANQLMALQFDEYGRVTNSFDGDNIDTALNYDFLGRLTSRQVVTDDGSPSGVENFSYNALGLTNYSNPLGYQTTFGYDTAGRLLNQTNANLEIQQFTYNAADETLTLKDGKNQMTTWAYDVYGRETNKLDALGTNIFRYQYDPLNRLTNRWTPARGYTTYKFDPLGNLTNVIYQVSSNIVFLYDPFNRLTNMADGVGSTSFQWTEGDQLAGETGPWASDAVNYTYNGARQRVGLSLDQPNAAPWNQAYDYDAYMHLQDVISPAGDFNYNYLNKAGRLISKMYLPGGQTGRTMNIQNTFDSAGRMVNNVLETPLQTTVTSRYQYDAASEVTQQTFPAQVFAPASTMNYGYDKIGQLTSAHGFEPDGVTPRWHEQLGYAYDKAWNLTQRTNNALVQSFGVNVLNEFTNTTRAGTLTVGGSTTELSDLSPYSSTPGVTNVTVSGTSLSSSAAEIYVDGTWSLTNVTPANGVNTYVAIAQDNVGRYATNSVSANLPASAAYNYDLNGNLLSDGLRNFSYDDENELVSAWVASAWSNSFAYDGIQRRRIERDYSWSGSAWTETNEVHFIYDGNLVVQERNAVNLPQITYTRGNDMSGSLDGAGGIGGLLARTQNSSLLIGDPSASAYYIYDRNGNVKSLVNTNGVFVAEYNYDPFGNMLSMSGPLAQGNVYRFSSQAWNNCAGIYYYGRRFYDPNLQKWINRDPINEVGGYNLFEFAFNDSINVFDVFGLAGPTNNPPTMTPPTIHLPTNPTNSPTKPPPIDFTPPRETPIIPITHQHGGSGPPITITPGGFTKNGPHYGQSTYYATVCFGNSGPADINPSGGDPTGPSRAPSSYWPPNPAPHNPEMGN